MPIADGKLHTVSIVVPVYRGERTLRHLVDEVLPLTTPQVSPDGVNFVVRELLLVHDCGPDRSDVTIEALAAEFPFVQPIWLSRNFGQHPATIAGMASASSDWVVTVDEDGQQNPADLGKMLDVATAKSLQLVYARPTNPPPHGWLRNFFSRTVKNMIGRLLGSRTLGHFNSFRLVDGEIARSLAAYCGNGVYLDIGLYWVAGRVGHCPLALREERDRPSGYSYWKLIGHFWRLLFTTGTRPLRLITIMGFSSVLFAICLMLYALIGSLVGDIPVQGWASLLMIVAFFSGCILTALGVIAEYLVVTLGIVMGKPLYVVSSKPTRVAAKG
jgi:polyisoprenyl-phosphate glycosyltransferase